MNTEVAQRLVGSRYPLWALCLVIVLAVHGALVAAALLHRVEPAPSLPPASVMMLELAATPQAPSATPAPQAPQVEKAAQLQPDPEPIPVPETKPVEKPAIVLPKKPKPRPKRRTEPVQRREQSPQPDARSQRDAAPPASAAQNSNVAAAPAEGAPGASHSQHVSNSWVARLTAHLSRYKRYPNDAPRHVNTARTTVYCEMDASGNVISARIQNSSGYPAFDNETLRMLERASPLPAPPKENLRNGKFSLSIPIRYDRPR